MASWQWSTPLPGLYVWAAALVLRGVFARWYPVPPWRVLIGFLLLVSAFLWPALFGGRVLLPLHLLTKAPPFERLELSEAPLNETQYDLVLEVAPNQYATRRFLAAGEWPLWNPAVGGGMPMLGDPQAHSHWLQPLTAPALVVPLPQSFGAVAAFRILAALVFTFLLLRLLGCAGGPAFFGSVAYGFGGFLILWLGWPIANSAALLPFLLFTVALTAEKGSRQDWPLLCVAIFATLLAGHPETILYMFLLAASVCLGYLFRIERHRRRPLLARWLGTTALAFGCAAPALLPTAEYLPATHRHELVERRNDRLAEEDALSGWRTTEARREALTQVARRLGPAVAPNALGNSFVGRFWGEESTYLSATGFAGTLTLGLAIASVFARGVRFPLERGIAWVGLPLAFVILARPPGLIHLFASLPGLNQSASHHSRVTLLLGFFLALLASFSLERWRRGEESQRALIMGCIVAVAVVVLTYKRFAPADPTVLADLRRSSVALQSIAPLLGLVLLWCTGNGAWRRPAGAVLLSLVGFTEACYFGAPAVPALSRALFYPETGSLRFLQNHVSANRVLGLGDVLRPNVPSLFGLPDPRISSPSKPWDYTLLVSEVSRSAREITDVFDRASHPLYRLLGVRYLLIRDEFPLEPHLKRVLHEDGLLVYEHPDPLPLLFLPESAETLGNGWLSWTAQNSDFRWRSIVEPSGTGERLWGNGRSGSSSLTLTKSAPTRIVAQALLTEPRLLASSLYQDGNWHLLAEGRRVPTVRTNGVFAGGWLSAGKHRIELLYRPKSFVFGCLLAALALVMALTWWTAGPFTAQGLRAGSSTSLSPPSLKGFGEAPPRSASASAP